MTTRVNDLKSSIRSALFTPRNRLFNFIDPPILVLLYHRVTSLPSDPEMLAVTPENFRAQLRYLKEHCPVLRFEEEWGAAPKPAVVITFDDGYADNLREVVPILEELALPATFFITTGTIGNSGGFWWHELERIILEKRNLPPAFTLTDTEYGGSWSTATISERQTFYQEMVRFMNHTTGDLRSNVLRDLRIWAEEAETADDRHRTLTVEELQQLAGSHCATIGAHTVTHTRLSTLSAAAQEEEIVTSKKQLEAWLNRDISLFSYPFGRRPDYTDASINLCRKAGFTKVAANFPGQVHRWTDQYQIPRHLVRNWPVELFAAKLEGLWTR